MKKVQRLTNRLRVIQEKAYSITYRQLLELQQVVAQNLQYIDPLYHPPCVIICYVLVRLKSIITESTKKATFLNKELDIQKLTGTRTVIIPYNEASDLRG
jgi:hypothetical protein